MVCRTLIQMAKVASQYKEVLGTTENAVAIITYCLGAIVHYDNNLERSTYEVLQIISISLMDKTHLTDLFKKTKFNDV